MSRLVPAPDALVGSRFDVAVSKMLGISRAKAADLIESGQARVLDRAIAKSGTLLYGETVEFDIAEERHEPEPVCLDMAIVYEDDDVVVVDKPVGVAAHASAGWTGPTVLGSLLKRGVRITSYGAPGRQGGQAGGHALGRAGPIRRGDAGFGESRNRTHASDSRAFLFDRASSGRRPDVWGQSGAGRGARPGPAVVACDEAGVSPPPHPSLDVGRIPLPGRSCPCTGTYARQACLNWSGSRRLAYPIGLSRSAVILLSPPLAGAVA